jgi:nitrate/nitrite transporter NarK
MPLFVAPIAGALSDRIGGHRLMGVGLTLQATGVAPLAAISADDPVLATRRAVRGQWHRYGDVLGACV